ncbi:M16 family metallopeptidase [Vibrio profundi]|uniref:M16 family metallopeptidase n=1 Tax=Vibrio profundi TaxID=1774960 RepID=UPI003735F8EC
MKPYYLVSALCVALVGCSSTPPQTLIKSDPYWVSGILDNGLKYHVYPDPEKPVSVRLLVHAGSFQETEQQLGYAHFVEHMAFNGSKNFSQNDVIRLFEDAGVSFGADLNAYTSYQETVYKLDLPDKSKLEQAITWLRDIGDGLDISDQEVEKEKGVILGEFRYSRTEDKPIAVQFYDHMIEGSPYETRDAIGTKESVNQANASGLKSYYQTWYQPQLAEVIVSGDVTLSEILPLIEERFSSWQKGDTPRPHKQKISQFNHEDLVAHAGGGEPPSIAVVTDRGARVIESREQQQQLWLDEMSQQLIQERISRVFVDAALPIQWSFSTNYLMEYQRYSVTSVAFPEHLREQSQAEFLATLASLRDHGVTQAEISGVMERYQESYDNIRADWDKMNSIDHANGKATALVIDQAVQSELDYRSSLKAFLASVDLDMINDNLDDLLSDDYFIVLGLAKNEDQALLASKLDDLKSAYRKSGEKPLMAMASTAFSVPENQGDIIAQTQIFDDPQLEQWTLSNGVEVWYLRDMNVGQDVAVYYASLGGKAALDNRLFPAVEVAIPTSIRSGVGDFNGSDLHAHLKRKDIEIYPFINFTHHGFEIHAKQKSLAESLAALHAILTQAKAEPEQLEAVKQEFTQNRNAYLDTPVGEFTQMLNRNSYLENSRHIMLEGKDIASVTTQDIQSIYTELFKTLRNNRLVIVGNVKPAELKPLLRQYVASVPLTPAEIPEFDVAYRPTYQDKIDVSINNEDSSQYLLRVIADAKGGKTAKDVFMDDMLQRVITTRLSAYIREELSLDYAPFAFSVSQDSEPSNDWFVGAQVAPENADKIEMAIDKVIADTLKGISEKETQAAAKQLAADLEPMNTNPVEKAWFISRYLIHDYGIEAIFDVQAMTDSISSDDMSEHAQSIFGEGSHTLKGIMRPQS